MIGTTGSAGEKAWLGRQRRAREGGSGPVLRPLRAADAAALGAFLDGLSFGARYFRFGHGDAVLSAETVRAMCTPDPRDGAGYAIFDASAADVGMIGFGGYCVDLDRRGCELALVIADAWQGRGLGRRLIAVLADDARRRGLRQVTGRVLASNRRMLDCASGLGFRVEPWDGSGVVMRVVLTLASGPE